MSQSQTLALGSKLTPETFAEFVARLHHDTKGEGVNDHCTADAVFLVERRVIFSGVDPELTDQIAGFDDEGSRYSSPEHYWNEADRDLKGRLSIQAEEDHEERFLDLSTEDQWEVIKEVDDSITVTGWDERWEYVCTHFTKAAAEAWIERKKHDYRDGLRVYADAQTYCWEFNAIKEALRDGLLVLADKNAEGK